ncbi:MAG: SurA N-terminal domain-containing protein [Bacteroidaceae bacterium]|nr:SurA N-terminal domain-containing protein [Bacteroidaceae bacterium]
MATLQTIRSKGALLILVVGLALFAFIAEEAVRSLSSSKAESHQRIAEIYGNSMNVQEFNKLVDEQANVTKLLYGLGNLTEEQMQQLRDQVWNTYVQNTIIAHEAEELGLTVTDAEVQDIIKNSRSQLLMQTPFRNEQTGAFDVQQLNKFLTDYKAMQGQAGQPAQAMEYYNQIYALWQYIEKNIRIEALGKKYNALLNNSFIANPVALQMGFDDQSREKTILMAAVPYSTVSDNDIQVSDAELKSMYEEKKPIFEILQPTRDIKYIDVAVKASETDRQQLEAEMAEVAEQLAAEGADYASVVRKSGSSVTYQPIPVRGEYLPYDINNRIDTIPVGTQVGPYANAGDNTLNIIRVNAKYSLPDSVQLQQIIVDGTADASAAQRTADSIVNALAAGAPFDTIARKYNQNGDLMWLTSSQYERGNIEENSRELIRAINAQAAGTTQKIVLPNKNIVINRVADRRNFVEKYDVAVVKRVIDFSNDTFNKTFNEFSQFVASNQKLEDLEANAVKAGYNVQEQTLTAIDHRVANLTSTRELFRWIFNDDTKANEISDIYTVGNNNHLIVACLTGRNDSHYTPLTNKEVDNYVRTEVIRNKKAATIKEKMAACKDVAAVARIAGAQPVDTLRRISFSSPVFIASIGASEMALSGAVAAVGKGSFVNGVQGNTGVYAFQVIDEGTNAAKFDDNAKQQQKQSIVRHAQNAASRFIQVLQTKAGIEDRRYLFY